jgi:hypothetical protein
MTCVIDHACFTVGIGMPRKAAKTDANAAVEGKRYPLNMRTTFELRRDLEVAAKASGRSLAQEAEYRLERSFLGQQGVFDAMEFRYGQGTAGILLILGDLMNLIGMSTLVAASNSEKSREWWNNKYAFDQAKKGVDVILSALEPDGDIESPTSAAGSELYVKQFGERQAKSLLDAITSETRPDEARQARIVPLLGKTLTNRIRQALRGTKSK